MMNGVTRKEAKTRRCGRGDVRARGVGNGRKELSLRKDSGYFRLSVLSHEEKALFVGGQQ